MTGTYLTGKKKPKNFIERPPVQVWTPRGWQEVPKVERQDEDDPRADWFSALFRIGRKPEETK